MATSISVAASWMWKAAHRSSSIFVRRRRSVCLVSSLMSGWTASGSSSRLLDVSELLVAILRSSSSRARGRHPNLPAAYSVALMRTPAILVASCSVMESVFSVFGGPTIMSREQSSMLALTLSLISEEREEGAIPESRIESCSVSRDANVCLSPDANATGFYPTLMNGAFLPLLGD